ncbi:MAG: hypothetical protein ABI833_09275, partial [Acidobacteriota bacterium]
ALAYRSSAAASDDGAPLNTTAGGVIALLAYWLWPTWERHQVAEGLAGMLDAFRVYFQAVRDGLLTIPSKINRDRACDR